MSESWMSPEELRAVAKYCEVLAPLWDALTGRSESSIHIETESVELTVYAGNGDKLGRITWAEEGAAFYPERA